VVIADALVLEETLVVAAGGDGPLGEGKDPQNPLGVFRIPDSDAPGGSIRLGAGTGHVPPGIHQGHAVGSGQQGYGTVDRQPLGVASQVQVDTSLQEERPIDLLQGLHATLLEGLGDLLWGWGLGSLLVAPEAPEFQQTPQARVEVPLAEAVKFAGLLDALYEFLGCLVEVELSGPVGPVQGGSPEAGEEIL
jgi:hypothetical protein